MTRTEKRMAARWVLLALVVGGLFMAGVAAGLRSLEGAYVADQRDRVELVASEGSWTPAPQSGIHYQEATVVGPDPRPVVRHG